MNLSKLALLASAIATQEGWFNTKSNLPQTNNNPGDLRASPLNLPKDKAGFVVFPTPAIGIAALYHQILLDAMRGLTVGEFIYKFAPPSENNSQAYLKNVLRWTGLTSETHLWELVTIGDVRKV